MAYIMSLYISLRDSPPLLLLPGSVKAQQPQQHCDRNARRPVTQFIDSRS